MMEKEKHLKGRRSKQKGELITFTPVKKISSPMRKKVKKAKEKGKKHKFILGAIQLKNLFKSNIYFSTNNNGKCHNFIPRPFRSGAMYEGCKKGFHLNIERKAFFQLTLGVFIMDRSTSLVKSRWNPCLSVDWKRKWRTKEGNI